MSFARVFSRLNTDRPTFHRSLTAYPTCVYTSVVAFDRTIVVVPVLRHRGCRQAAKHHGCEGGEKDCLAHVVYSYRPDDLMEAICAKRQLVALKQL